MGVIIISYDPEFNRERPGQYGKMRFCISVEIISVSSGSHVTLPQHLLSFFLRLVVLVLGDYAVGLVEMVLIISLD